MTSPSGGIHRPCRRSTPNFRHPSGTLASRYLHLAVVHLGEEIELAPGGREHTLEGLVFENAVEAPEYLALGGHDLLAVEFVAEEGAGRTLELVAASRRRSTSKERQ